MAMAERAGLDLDLVAATIAAGQAASPQVVRNTRRMVDDDHDRNIVFTGRLRRKDADYAIRMADALGVDAPFGRAALDGLDALLAAGLGDLNESSIIEIARRPGQ
jgi:3-hydroxyisobutyrate dehydrogenase